MAYQFATNTNPADSPVALYTLLTTLVAAGWTVKGSSDGSTFSLTGNILTSGSAVPNGLGNALAWFRIQAPAVNGQTREFTFQPEFGSPGSRQWRIKYSAAAGFVGGSPSATQTPSATDESITTGGGTDVSPTFTQIFDPSGTYYFSCAAGDATVGFAWYWVTFVHGGTKVTKGSYAMETMLPGSFPAADLDPCIIYPGTSSASSGNSGFGAATSSDMNTQTAGHMGAVDNAHFVKIIPVQYDVNSYFPANQGVNAWTSKDDCVPIPWTRGAASPVGFKGFGQMMLFGSTSHANGDTVSIASAKDHIYVNGTLLPWDGSTPVLT